eukprot:939466-Rhodomonas_salina.1
MHQSALKHTNAGPFQHGAEAGGGGGEREGGGGKGEGACRDTLTRQRQTYPAEGAKLTQKLEFFFGVSRLVLGRDGLACAKITQP